MTNGREAQKIIDDFLEIERLKKIILDTSRVSWGHCIQEQDIDLWLENFNGRCLGNQERECKIALWLLAHCTYYTEGDIRALCRELYDAYIHRKLSECPGDIRDLSERIPDILDNTLFLGLGNDSESGNNILYYFRQENELPKKNFSIKADKRYQNIVYIDDVTLSGGQAGTYIKQQNLHADHIYVAALIASEYAMTVISNGDTEVVPIATVLVDDRDKAFSDRSHMFSDEKIAGIKELVKEFCIFYGNTVIKDYDDMDGYPLGYKDGQYLMAFHYNTPNNTLPVFWGESGGWKPIFKRYPKLYSGKARRIDERKYY